MKRNIMLFVLALGVVMTSCGKMENQQAATESDSEVVVNFSLGYATKATSGIDDDAINTAYVFAFDGNRLDGSAQVTSSTGSINVTPGSRRFIAVVNPNNEFTFTNVTSPASLMAIVSQLSSEGIADMVMVGENTVTVSGTTSNVAISVTRLVSKISINSLKFQLSGALAGKTVSNVSVYIKNYPTTMTYGGVAGTSYTSGLFSDNQASFEVYDAIGNVTSGSAALGGYHFFCYERPTQNSASGKNCIRLCIKGDINGQTYYWSIPVNNGSTWKTSAFQTGDNHYGVKRNHSYAYDITVTRAGVPDDGQHPNPTDPTDNGDDDLEDDEDVTVKSIVFTLTVNDFIPVAEQTVTF